MSDRPSGRRDFFGDLKEYGERSVPLPEDHFQLSFESLRRRAAEGDPRAHIELKRLIDEIGQTGRADLGGIDGRQLAEVQEQAARAAVSYYLQNIRSGVANKRGNVLNDFEWLKTATDVLGGPKAAGVDPQELGQLFKDATLLSINSKMAVIARELSLGEKRIDSRIDYYIEGVEKQAQTIGGVKQAGIDEQDWSKLKKDTGYDLRHTLQKAAEKPCPQHMPSCRPNI